MNSQTIAAFCKGIRGSRDIAVLAYLLENDGTATMGDARRALGFPNGAAMTGIANRLREAGLAEKTEHHQDERKRVLVLTGAAYSIAGRS